jgi:hypothetical protein
MEQDGLHTPQKPFAERSSGIEPVTQCIFPDQNAASVTGESVLQPSEPRTLAVGTGKTNFGF